MSSACNRNCGSWGVRGRCMGGWSGWIVSQYSAHLSIQKTKCTFISTPNKDWDHLTSICLVTPSAISAAIQVLLKSPSLYIIISPGKNIAERKHWAVLPNTKHLAVTLGAGEGLVMPWRSHARSLPEWTGCTEALNIFFTYCRQCDCVRPPCKKC